MKSSKLIEKLQKIDPHGNMEVSIGNSDIWEIVQEPAYYDGKLHLIEFDENYRPIWGRRTSTGSKIVLTPISIQDAIENYENFVVEYENEDDRKRYEPIDVETRRKSDEIDIRLDREFFINWVFQKIQSIRTVPMSYIQRISDAAAKFYDDNMLGPDNPVLTMQGGKSYNDCREDYLEDTYRVDWDKYSRIIIEKR